MSDLKASFGKALTALEALEVDTTELDTLKRGILANGFADAEWLDRSGAGLH